MSNYLELANLVLASRFPLPEHKLTTLFFIGRCADLDNWDDRVALSRFVNVPLGHESKFVLDLLDGPLWMYGGPVGTISLCESDLRALAAGRAEFTASAHFPDSYSLVHLSDDRPKIAGKKPIPPRMRLHVFERDGYRCRICGSSSKLRADHVFPESRGGRLELGNLQTLCASCNSAKGATVPEGSTP